MFTLNKGIFQVYLKNFYTKIFNIRESMVELRKHVIKKGVCGEQQNSVGIYLKSEIQENLISR